MTAKVLQPTYAILRKAIMDFVAEHPNTAMERFKTNVAQVGTQWRDATQVHLAAAEFLDQAMKTTMPETHALAAVFHKYRNELNWEQSYTMDDKLVGQDMLNGYGFVEVIGKNGPFVSRSVRCGIGVWGSDINYPVHNHMAEEVYVPLAGNADFTLDGSPYRTRSAGDIIHVPSNQRHGFRTTSSPFVVFYGWQAGDLRQKSTFG